jgi:choline dehydrogenase-like flavoprotein
MRYDYIIIGSGAGGSAACHSLVKAGKQVLLLEKGSELPKDGTTLDFTRVINEGVFKSKERWLNKNGKPFMPEEYFNLGGKTKWYGAALVRFDETEFDADPDFKCLGWPISYDDLAPYYDRIEKLLAIRTFPIEPDLKNIQEKIDGRQSGWNSRPLPLGLNPAILDHENEARHFDGFASVRDLKADAQTSLLAKLMTSENLHMVTGHAVTQLIADKDNPLQLAGVRLENGQVHTAGKILLAAGAMHSPRLLQTYLASYDLANTLPCARLIGKYFKRHILTAMLSISPSIKSDKLRKTTAWFNAGFSHSSVQPLGFSEDVLTALLPRIIPRWLARQLGKRTYGFFLQTEDGSSRDNQVKVVSEGAKLPALDYDLTRIPASDKEHRRMVGSFRAVLRQAGYLSFVKSIPLEGTAHACGTLVTGNKPSESVVDANGKVHGLHNLYVVDGSILPRSSRVNPALTIYAWALRVADHLLLESKGG